MKRCIAFALALLVAGAAAADPPPVAIISGELGARIDAAVTARGDFWGAVLVARGGEILLAKGYGMADYDARPNEAGTLFEIASISKQVTAAAVLKLRQQGKLGLDDPIARHLGIAVRGDMAKITVRHLLNHTSGVDPEAGVPYDSPMSRGQFISYLVGRPLVSKPGERFAYSNAAYALLAAIVERASGTTFEAYCKAQLFAPAGMSDTAFIGDKGLDADRASTRRSEGRRLGAAAQWHWSWGYRGMGGVVTTVLDMHRWDRALRGNTILDDAARKDLYAPALEGYALGWLVEQTPRGTRRVHHGGGVAGYRAQYARWLEDDAVVVVLTNDQGNPHAIEQAIGELLFPPPTLSARLSFAGYELAHKCVEITRVAWEVTHKKDTVELALRDVALERTVATIVVPSGVAAKLAVDLERVLAGKVKGPPVPVGSEGGLYLGPYTLADGSLELSEGLALSLQPRYVGSTGDGGTVTDERVLLTLTDSKFRQWPVMSKLDLAAARALLGALRPK